MFTNTSDSCIPGPHSDCLLCWHNPSQQGAVCWQQQDGDVVGEAKMGVRRGSVRTLDVRVHTVQSIISPCRNGDVLLKTGQSVRQFHVIKVPSNHFVCSKLMVHVAPSVPH
ncbi:hypothetical protein XENOCAPTIV_014378 [Xenoophorus captivus]|uniref:Uncharacterized protein n=1 Tax=Xenoophorus captivus TaxID=1517983 RepID=A0ABV0R8U1_9TELE